MPRTSASPLYHPKYWFSWLGMFVLQVIVLLPSPVLIQLGRLLGRLLLKVAKRRRHICKTNLELCFPELNTSQQKQLLIDTFEANGIGIIEAAMSWLKPGSTFLKVNVNNLELMQKLQAQGKGVLMVSAHFTSIDIAGRALGSILPFNVIYRPQNNPVVNYFMERGRRRYLDAIPINQHDIRGMIRSLKSGDILWYPADQDHGIRSSVFAPFMVLLQPHSTCQHGL